MQRIFYPMQKLKKLRVHHMLCIPLYVGEGYGDEFNRNMRERIAWLRANPDAPLALSDEPDMICEGCPNRTESNTCVNDRNQVREKDRRLAKELDLSPQTVYTYRELERHFRTHMTEEIFNRSCQSCQWFAKGLCNYSKYRQRILKSSP